MIPEAFPPMKKRTRMWSRSRYLVLLVVYATVLADRAGAQDNSLPFANFASEPILPSRLLLDGNTGLGGEATPAGRAARFQMFRMPAGFIHDPVGLDMDDDPSLTAEGASSSGPEPGDSFVGAAIGADNPYFDVRLPGDPGGLGYQRVHTQCQVMGDRFTSMCVGVQAFTPAGLENNGLTNGPTILSPNLSLFHEWESGLAVQGFIAKTLPARAGWTDDFLRRSVHCGVGVQSPFPGVGGSSVPDVHWFLEALGSIQRMPGSTAPAAPFVGVIPGLHWRLGDNWWMSSGVVLPVGTTHYEPGKLQITCSWRF
jgi:hypothetical protein